MGFTTLQLCEEHPVAKGKLFFFTKDNTSYVVSHKVKGEKKVGNEG